MAAAKKPSYAITFAAEDALRVSITAFATIR
jgi:hypothetical protein